MSKLPIPAGTIFGRLVVVGEVSEAGRPRRFTCRCECGNTVIAVLSELRRGNTTSCGCLATELRSAAVSRRNTLHGDSDSRTHRIWRAMKTRCNNPLCSNYALYGGRGITVCQAWRDSYEQFIADMGKCPDGCSIDRIDNDGHYEPGNCRWATPKEQANNRRRRTCYRKPL